MKQVIKLFLTHRLSSAILLGFGVLLLLLSYFFPIVKYHFQNDIYHSMIFHQFVSEVINKKFLMVFVFAVILYPYVFVLLLTSIIFIRNLVWLKILKVLFIILSLSGLLVNLYIYFGYYIAKLKNNFAVLLGIILMGAMLFSYYYFLRLRRLQVDELPRILYLAFNLIINSFITFAFYFSIVLGVGIPLLVGSYCFLFGLIFVSLGLYAFFYQARTDTKVTFVLLSEEVRKPSLISRIKKKNKMPNEN